MFIPVPTSSIATSFAQIIHGLTLMLGRAYDRDHSLARLISLITTRLYRMRSDFAARAAQAQAGTLRVRSPLAGSPARREAAAARPRHPMRQGFGWMSKLAPGTGYYGAELHRLLLDDPEMARLLEAAPQLGRMLRSILWMTGLRPVPETLRRAAPPRARRPRPAPAVKVPPPAPQVRVQPPWETPYRPSAQWPKGCITKPARRRSRPLATAGPNSRD